MMKRKSTESKEVNSQRLDYLLNYKGSKSGSFFPKKDVSKIIEESVMDTTLNIIDEELKKLNENLN
jgi:hypothetical protein